MIEKVVKQMTLKEKVGQLNQKLYGWQCYEKKDNQYILTEYFKNHIQEFGGVGAIYGIMRADAWTKKDTNNGISRAESAEIIDMIQTYIKENTRLQIPALISEECVHGHMANNSPVYPTNLALGMTWNPKLMKQVCHNVGEELAAKHGNLALFTGFDVLRDPRWGRSEECFSEDSFLTKKMTKAAVEGFNSCEEYGINVVVKHLAGQGDSIGGHNSDAAMIGERELRDIHLPPLIGAIEGQAHAVMAAYNEIDGIPCHINKHLMTTILRDEYQFDGIVMADGCALDRLLLMNQNPELMASKALKAGVDLSLWDDVYLTLDKAVEKGYLSMEDIDKSVIRILKLKERLGLFENRKEIPLPDSSELLLTTARESQVLLKNDNQILPLSKDKKIAVIGPNAKTALNMLGDYTGYQDISDIVTIYDGITKKTKLSPLYAKGCSIRQDYFEDLEEALEIAKEADVVVLALGGSSARLYENQFESNGAVKNEKIQEMNCGENIDVSSLALEGKQVELLKRLKNVNPHIISVLIQGRPHAIPEVIEYSQAVLASWYPGTRGGDGISDVLFGDYNPSGHLSVSIPHSSGQLPCYYNHKNNGAQKDYVDISGKALLPFGYGLSYSTFVYENIEIQNSIQHDALLENGLKIAMDIKNVSDFSGEDVVQFYLIDHQSSIVQRVKSLIGFKKVFIESNQTKHIELILDGNEFKVWNDEMNYVLENGDVSICIGHDSTQYQEYKLEIIE